jgi:uncharacterized linocin/CFP29 family protein
MDDRNAQVGWTEAQWNRVREEVLRAWQSVRVAGSFLPVYGSLPPSTQVVPSEVLKPDGTFDERSVAPLLEISLPVTLSRQQVLEEDLEDWYIFNGTYPSFELLKRLGLDGNEVASLRLTAGDVDSLDLRHLGSAAAESANPDDTAMEAELPVWRPSNSYLKDLPKQDWPSLAGFSEPIAELKVRTTGLRRRNPGALGLFEGGEVVSGQGIYHVAARPLSNEGLIDAIVDAMQLLEIDGYVAPYVCVFGRGPFKAAHEPITTSPAALPRDRLEPLLGRELLQASAINVVPQPLQRRNEHWENRGVLLSLAGDAVDLAIAAEATPEFRTIDSQGRFVFSVFERFALRIKDPRAIVPLRFEREDGPGQQGAQPRGRRLLSWLCRLAAGRVASRNHP